MKLNGSRADAKLELGRDVNENMYYLLVEAVNQISPIKQT